MKTKLFSPLFSIAAAFGLMLCLGAGLVHASTFGSIKGKVTDADGKAVAGVKISLAGEGSVTTDKGGSYSLDGIDPGDFKLEATKKGYDKTTQTVTITQDVPLELDLTVTKSAAKSDAKTIK